MVKIVLDAGHGYNTPGKRIPDGSMREWEFNNAVALKVAKNLEGYTGIEYVLFTHDKTGEQDIPLETRTDLANKCVADVLVSIHANANGTGGWDSANGIETFTHNAPSKQSLILAAVIQGHLIRETNRDNRGIKKASFHMVRESKCPAVLVECGFMTNKEEAELLKTDKYRNQCAEAITKGLVEVYKLKKVYTSKPIPTKEKVEQAPNTQVKSVIVEGGKTVIKKDDEGQIVEVAQLILKYKYHDISVDGKFGAKTEKEVKLFQRNKKLKDDGVIGTVTWEELTGDKGGLLH